MAEQSNGESNGQEVKQEERKVCGIIMPISASENYSGTHWEEVRNILEEVIDQCDFIANLVSDAEEIGIIHNRIVTNIVNNPIVICDVSSKNPNVMFELGLRLAFDKATIVIKDDLTPYTFDTSPIEHLTYPKDLRYKAINKFKGQLKDKLVATYNASSKEGYSTFLKHFVQYKAKLETQEVGTQEYLTKRLDRLEDILGTTLNQFSKLTGTYDKPGIFGISGNLGRSGYSGSPGYSYSSHPKSQSYQFVYDALKREFDSFKLTKPRLSKDYKLDEIKREFISYANSSEKFRELELLLSIDEMDALSTQILQKELPIWIEK